MEGTSDTLDSLKARIEQTPFEEISAGLKAQLCCEMVKDALANQKVTPEAALNFANSLIYESIIPVTIGTKDIKIFPIQLIMQARPLIVQQMREAAKAEGIDFDTNCTERSQKAEKVLAKMEADYKTAYSGVGSKFGPFAQYLTSEQKDEAASEALKAQQVARQVLYGGDASPELVHSISTLMKVDVPNVMFGQDLRSHVENLKSTPHS